MFMVVMAFSDDLFVEADDYEVDEDGDLVFVHAADADEADEFGDDEDFDGFVEDARVAAGAWAAVVPAEVEDEDEDEGE